MLVVTAPQPGGSHLLEIYNSLTRQREAFAPIEPGVARMYVCGITPYDVGHLGHALVFVTFDVVRRYLEFNSHEVRHVQNITDVDDDMVRKSRELGIPIPDLTDRNHAIYLREMDALNVLRPMAFPRVSASIPEIIELIQLLIAGGHAYVVEGHVFFDTSSCELRPAERPHARGATDRPGERQHPGRAGAPQARHARLPALAALRGR